MTWPLGIHCQVSILVLRLLGVDIAMFYNKEDVREIEKQIVIYVTETSVRRRVVLVLCYEIRDM